MNREELAKSLVQLRNEADEVVGTGFVFSASGLILTCAHVVIDAGAEPGDEVSISFLEGTKPCAAKARVSRLLWSDPNPPAHDLAVLDVGSNLPRDVAVANLGPPRDSATVYGLGFPGGALREEAISERMTAITGSYAKRNRRLEMTAPNVRPGHSGGPLLDEETGWVVGLVRAVVPGDATTFRAGVTAYGIPVETFAALVVEQLLAHPRDAHLAELQREVSRRLPPFSSWPSARVELGVLSSNQARDLIKALEACAVMEPALVPAVLCRLPADLLAALAVEPRPQDACGWATLLVQAAGSKWIDLLIAAVLEVDSSGAAQDVDKELAKWSTRTKRESYLQEIGAQIERCMKQEALSLREVRRRAVAVAGDATLTGFEKVPDVFKLMWLIRMLSEQSPGEGVTPLDTFAASFDVGAPDLESPEVLVDQEHSLMISIVEKEAGRFSANVWGLIGEDGKQPGSRKFLSDDETFSLAELRLRIDEIRGEFASEFEIADEQLWIEFVLQRPLLSEAVEQWLVSVGRQRPVLGKQHKVVVRSWERLYDARLRNRRGDWCKKWTRHHANPQLHPIRECNSTCQESLFVRLTSAEVSGATVNLALSADAGVAGVDPIDLCVDAGLPVVLWLRQQVGGVDEDPWLSLPPEAQTTLPSWLQERRRTADDRDSHISWRIALMWDNPMRVPPDAFFRRPTLGRRTT